LFPKDEELIVIPEFFIPKDTIFKRSKEDNVPYDVWAEDGLVHSTPGNAIDYSYIEQTILNDYEVYNIARLGRDRWQSTQMGQNLEAEGIEVVPIGQGFKGMSEPMKEIEVYVLKNKLIHFNHPVLRWMVENTVAKTDAADNIKPDKDKSNERIDGVTALTMAMDCYIREEDNSSIYEDRGVRTL